MKRTQETGINLTHQGKATLVHDKPVNESWEVYLLRIMKEAQGYRRIIEAVA